MIIAREKGGLGIGSLRAQNIALLEKWRWRFKTEDGPLWKAVIVSIHGVAGNLGEELGYMKWKGVWGRIGGIQKDLNPINIHLDSLFMRHFEGALTSNSGPTNGMELARSRKNI